MKKLIYLVLAMLLLCGCAAENPGPVQVGIVEDAHFTVLNNGQWVVPGEDAVFRLEMEPGLTVADTDHPGGHSVRIRDGLLELTIRDVRYPARIRLVLTDTFTAITYDPNGGAGEETTLIYDLSKHARPNTAADLYTRDGYTLESWNMLPDGTGTRVGLGSRITPEQGLTLYARWEKWNDASDFTYTEGVDITITGYRGSSDAIVIPECINGKNVAAIGHGAFQNCTASRLILPKTMKQVARGAFQNCAFESVTLFDTIENISDDSFRGCANLRTIQINTQEPPFGYSWRKESCYADKVDLLIAAEGRKKLVCYGGCAIWYNLDGGQMDGAFGNEYEVINMGLNGLANSAIQMQIMASFMGAGDILFHTPELSSGAQMMRQTLMDRDDDKLWCGMENNYDLVPGGIRCGAGPSGQLLADQGHHYTVCPFGLYAAVGTSAMLDLCRDTLGEGDIVVLTVEPTSETISAYFGAEAFWKCAEADPGLLLRVSREKQAALFGNYVGHLQQRRSILASGDFPAARGVYAAASFNDRCDMIFHRPGNTMAVGYDTASPVDLAAVEIGAEFAQQVNDICALAEKKGASVVMSFSPVNRAALTDPSEEAVSAFFTACNGAFACPMISDPNRYILDSGWFYDSNFHLNSAGAQLRTCCLAEDLLAWLGCYREIVYEVPAMPAPVVQLQNNNADPGDFTFERIAENNGYLVSGLTESGLEQTQLQLPASFGGKPVIGFTADALAGAARLTELRLPESIESLPEGLFRETGNLTRLVLEHTGKVCTVTEGTFAGADQIRIYVPAAVYPMYRDGYGCESNPWEPYLDRIHPIE